MTIRRLFLTKLLCSALFVICSTIALIAQTLYIPSGTSGIGSSSNSNVGIGTANPGGKFEISGSGNGLPSMSGTSQPNLSIRLGNAITNGILDIGINGGSGAWLQYTDRLDLSQTYPLLLNPNGGNVGIGTTSPTQKLSVNGTIRAKEVIVDTGWADYVFASDYRLASLSEVETHIKANGHLPGIPSAKEVAEHGVSMGEMQAKLLAKIEELTLHVIEQEKQQTLQAALLATQSARLEKMETENADLREKLRYD